MVKKSIIAIAMIAMLAGVTFAQDLPFNPPDGQIKYDGSWPITCQYTPITICCFDVFLKVGMFVEVNCKDLKITLVQVNCDDQKNFPCYSGCTNVKVSTNFEVLLTATFTADNAVGIVQQSKTKLYFLDGDTPPDNKLEVPAGGNGGGTQLCLDAWDANIYKGTPGQNPKVGEVCITAVPTGSVICDSYTAVQ